jgi:hypothetical protein
MVEFEVSASLEGSLLSSIELYLVGAQKLHTP